jgi:hypothetical protein
MVHVPGSGSAYEYSFSAQGAGRYNPQVTVTFSDGSSQTHAEIFQVEKTAPILTFQDVKLANIEGKQI